MKSGYLLTTDLLFTHNYEMLSASEAACDSTEQVVLYEREENPLATFSSLCFVHSSLHLVQSQNDCYKVYSIRGWLSDFCWHSLLDDMFHNKERFDL